MSWESHYLPPDPVFWQGRSDIPSDSCFYQHMRLLNLLTDSLEKQHELTFAILGFKCDEGVQRDLRRTGAFEGPIAIRHRLAKLPVQSQHIHCFDVGNIVCTDHDLEASQKALGEVVALLIENHMVPIIIGGGHEVAWGSYQGIAKVYPHQSLGIINFDAHFDLYPATPSHRSSSVTTFYEIAMDMQQQQRKFDYNCIGIQHSGNTRQSFDYAKEFAANYILADDLHQGLREKTYDFVDRIIDENEMIYLSLSLDVFSPAFAPGVSTIQPLGLNPWHVIPLIRQAAASKKVVSYDISEHVPRYDIDHRTAKLAATLIYEIIHHHALIKCE